MIVMEIHVSDFLREPEKALASAGWATRSEKSGAELEPTKDEIKKMVNYSKDMKLSSVLNIPFFVFSVKDVSRAFTHQWVRYRMAAHMQQSLRYVNISTGNDDWFVVPPSVSMKGADSVVEYVNSQLNSASSYRSLVKSKVPVEDARFALPIGTKTHITTAMNAEELMHVIAQRCCMDAQWEIRTVSYALMAAGLMISPMIFEGTGAHCISEGKCRGSGKGKCMSYAEEMAKKMRKVAKKKEGAFRKKDGEWLDVDLTKELGFEADRELKKEVAEKLGREINLDMPVVLRIRK